MVRSGLEELCARLVERAGGSVAQRQNESARPQGPWRVSRGRKLPRHRHRATVVRRSARQATLFEPAKRDLHVRLSPDSVAKLPKCVRPAPVPILVAISRRLSQSLSDVGPCRDNRWSTRSRPHAGLAVNARSRGETACDPLKVGEHAIAALVPQAPDRVCEKLVIVHEPASGTRAVSNSPPTTIYYNSLSRHLARNTPWLPPSRGCAMSSRNASAMRSPGVSASKARTNLPSGSMT